MTPSDRKHLAAIGNLIIQARYDPTDEFRETALEQAIAGIFGLLLGKGKLRPEGKRFQVVDMAKGNGVEWDADEVATIMVALFKMAAEYKGDEMGRTCGKLLEELRGL